MAYFPMFVDLEGQKVLIVGGGKVAARKVEKLLPFGCSITVVATKIRQEIRDLGVAAHCRAFDSADLDGCAMAIAATDEPELNKYVCDLAKQRGIPVNSVDDKDNCSFLFPALVKRGKLTVGVCTSGASPSAAKWVKERAEKSLPENTEAILDYLDALRGSLEPGQARQAKMAAAFDRCMALGRPLTEGEEKDL